MTADSMRSAPRLEGRLCRLRPFSAADKAAFVSQAQYPEMFEFVKFRYATRQAAADGFAWLMTLPQQADPRRRIFWAIETADDATFVGWAGMERATPEDGDEIGWYLLPPYWGQGYASDATAVLLRYGFSVLGSARMIATCDPDNVGSRRVLEKAGLISEGLMAAPVETWRGPRPRLVYATSREQ